MNRRLVFIGAGAIGSYLGAFLARAGHEVTLVDPWGEQVETIRAQGIRVTGPHEPFHAKVANIVHLNEAGSLPADFDVAFVAMKAYDTEWATRLCVARLSPSGYVVASQNCWTDPVVASVAGAERSVGLVMSKIGVAVWRPGEVERGMEAGRGAGHDVFRVGEHDGALTPRAKELAEMLSVVDGARPTDNLWGERWAKLSQNAMGNPVQAMTGLGNVEIAGQPRGREITIRLGQESARVGLALGYRIPPFGGFAAERWAAADQAEVYREIDAALAGKGTGGRNWRASMAQDVAKGRRTEIDYMNGHVVEQGRKAGVPTPVSGSVVALVREIDARARRPAPEHIELALKRAGG
jgi:2-dehydropantoate 2-reductase